MIEIIGKIVRIVLESIKSYIEQICNQGQLYKRHRTLGIQLAEIMSEIEEIWKFNGQLMVKLKTLKPKIKMKNVLKFEAKIEVC